ncbi:MAG: hypothetical protein NZ822_01020 [Patescibacteria group bacterium]|nr:hypothetical protein [Patescibacteria group bacterium]
MDYSSLFEKSWQITWNNKFLWIFGTIVFIFVGGINYLYYPLHLILSDRGEAKLLNFNYYFSFLLALINSSGTISFNDEEISKKIILAILISLLYLAFYFSLYNFFLAGLFAGIILLVSNQKANFSVSLKEGSKIFLKFLLLEIITFAILFISFILPLALIIYLILFLKAPTLISVLLTLIFIIILLILWIFISMINVFGKIDIALQPDLAFRKNLAQTEKVILRNKMKSLIIVVISFIVFLIINLIASILFEILINLTSAFKITEAMALIFYLPMSSVFVLVGGISLVFVFGFLILAYSLLLEKTGRN